MPPGIPPLIGGQREPESSNEELHRKRLQLVGGRTTKELIDARSFGPGVTTRPALRTLILDASDPDMVEVTSVLVDGQPVFGTAVRPLAYFTPAHLARDLRHTRRLICAPPLPFDWIEVRVRNVSRSEQIVAGGCILDIHRSLVS